MSRSKKPGVPPTLVFWTTVSLLRSIELYAPCRYYDCGLMRANTCVREVGARSSVGQPLPEVPVSFCANALPCREKREGPETAYVGLFPPSSPPLPLLVLPLGPERRLQKTLKTLKKEKKPRPRSYTTCKTRTGQELLRLVVTVMSCSTQRATSTIVQSDVHSLICLRCLRRICDFFSARGISTWLRDS